MKIGEIMPLDREITLNEGRKTVCIDVANTGDRPIQVGSHFHYVFLLTELDCELLQV